MSPSVRPPTTPAANWVADAAEIFAERGSFKHPRVGSALKPSVDRYGWEKVRVALVDFVKADRRGPHTPEIFAAEDKQWVALVDQPLFILGEPTERGRRRVGMSA